MIFGSRWLAGAGMFSRVSGSRMMRWKARSQSDAQPHLTSGTPHHVLNSHFQDSAALEFAELAGGLGGRERWVSDGHSDGADAGRLGVLSYFHSPANPNATDAAQPIATTMYMARTRAEDIIRRPPREFATTTPKPQCVGAESLTTSARQKRDLIVEHQFDSSMFRRHPITPENLRRAWGSQDGILPV